MQQSEQLGGMGERAGQGERPGYDTNKGVKEIPRRIGLALVRR